MPSKDKTTRGSTNDAIALLTADHKRVKALFKQFEKLKKDEVGDDEKAAVVAQICTELTIHATVEEEIFYPAVREAIDDMDLMDEADIEHASAKDLIAQLEGASPDEDHYDAKVTVLGEMIDHHVKEEEGEMFPKARRAIDIEAIGAEMAARKSELKAEMGVETDDESSDMPESTAAVTRQTKRTPRDSGRATKASPRSRPTRR